MNAKVLLFVFLVNCFLANSQTLIIRASIEIVGNSCTNDTTKKQVEFQKSVQNQYQTIKTFTTTVCQNEFVLPADTGNFKMVVNSYNCTEQEVPFQLKSGATVIELGKTSLFKQEKSVHLSEITVVGNKREFVKVDADKTTYLVKDNPALSSGSMSDAIRKLPGVIVSPSGNLNLNGKDVAIYIDGVPSNLSGPDLKNYIQSQKIGTQS